MMATLIICVLTLVFIGFCGGGFIAGCIAGVSNKENKRNYQVAIGIILFGLIAALLFCGLDRASIVALLPIPIGIVVGLIMVTKYH